MKLQILTYCALIAFVSFACQKEDPITPEESGGTLLSKVQLNDQPQYEYLYNYSNLLNEEISKFNLTYYKYNEREQLVTAEYFSDKELLSEDTKISENALDRRGLIDPLTAALKSSVKYEYDANGQLNKTIISRSVTSPTEYSEFTYDENDRMIRQTIFWDNKAAGYVDYTYDANGNLIKEMLYSISASGVAELNTTTLYEFDNNKNPYLKFNKLSIPGIYTNPNNIIKETLTIHFAPGQGTDITQVEETTYTYNSQGYPIKKNGKVEFLYYSK
jgi:hypothetical protein